MDTDWCLTCNKRVVSLPLHPPRLLLTSTQEGSSIYCSLQCQKGEGPSNYHRRPQSSYTEDPSCDGYLEDGELGEEVYLEDGFDLDEYNIEAVSKTNWAGRGSAGIRAWAAEIPLGAHPESQDLISPPSDDSFSVASTSSTASSTYRAPNLVRPSRPLPPSLTMTKPGPPTTTPPRPILNLQRHLAALTHSPGSTARTSAASEDSLPTPASASTNPMFSTLPGRPFPFISDARACDLAACTQLNSPPLLSRASPSSKDEDAHIMHSRGVPIAPRILSSPRSSLDDYDLSPPQWVTSSMVPHKVITRKEIMIPRGRRFSRVAA